MLNEYGIPIRRGEYAAIDIMTREDDFSRFKIPDKGFLTHAIKVPLDMNHMMIIGNILASTGPSTAKKQDLMEQCCRTILSQGKCRIGCSDIYSDLAIKIMTKAKNYTELFTVLSLGFILLAPEVFRLFASTEYWNGMDSVSYTHLDVYKRQGLHGLMKMKML